VIAVYSNSAVRFERFLLTLPPDQSDNKQT
jgi:hypothetical protein